jgi:hypothetical protein
MNSYRTSPGRTRRFRFLRVAAVLVAASLAIAAVATRPGDLNGAFDRPGEKEVFRFEMVRGQAPAPKRHMWGIHVSGVAGAPLFGATIMVDGGLPAGGQARAQRAGAGAAPGVYVLKAMKFSMPDWWALTLDIRAPDILTDKVVIALGL